MLGRVSNRAAVQDTIIHSQSPAEAKKIIERDGIDYPTDIASPSLRRAYETLFTNNHIFESFYKLICGHEWRIWLAPHAGGKFIRGDMPVLVDGTTEKSTWMLIYPNDAYQMLRLRFDSVRYP